MNKHKSQSKREARRQRRYDSMIKHCPTEALEKFREKPYQAESGGAYMLKQEVEFDVVTKNGAVTQIGKSQIYQPKTNFNGGEIKWFDDTKLIRKEKQYE